MIEFVVSMQGLMISNAMHAEMLSPATRSVAVAVGEAHPPTFVTGDGGFGFFDAGTYPPSEPSTSWVEGVFGMPTNTLLPRRRVNVIDEGSGIQIQIDDAVIELVVRSDDGTRVERRSWAGPGDFDVNGAIQQADMDSFMDAYGAGDDRADFNRDGRVSQADMDAFTTAWEGGGPAPCATDLTLDGMVDVSDLLMYLDFWFPGNLEADLADPVGSIDVYDLLEYLDGWFLGC